MGEEKTGVGAALFGADKRYNLAGKTLNLSLLDSAVSTITLSSDPCIPMDLINRLALR